MLDRFPLLTLSFSLILQNVCSWEVSAPLNHTFNEDDSVSVTCGLYGKVSFEKDVKLIMNDKPVCEVYEGSQEDKMCKWQLNDNKFTFTLMNPEAILKNVFFCEISKVRPLPIETKEGPKTKLFRGCSGTSVLPISNCSCSNQTHKEHTLEDRHSLEDYIYICLICGLIIVVMTLSLYSIILTVLYIRLKAIPEPSDTLTYVPMQRKVNRRDPDNTEYVDMREVQKRGGSHRDMNHNSHLITI